MIARFITPLFVALSALAGCSHVEQSPALTQTDPDLATQAHWIAQPATATVTHDNYDELWEACVGAARWHGFRPDRTDYRAGVLVTFPNVSKQLFEPWRRDVVTLPDMVESTLATMRRIVRFEITEVQDGTFQCVPKVIVERYNSMERRITSITQYRETFSINTAEGNKGHDRGVDLADTYWYAVGRDAALERDLAAGVRSRVRGIVARR